MYLSVQTLPIGTTRVQERLRPPPTEAGAAERVEQEELARATSEALGIRDQDALAFEAKPSAVCEISERLVDGLAGSADELGDLFLREVVSDAQGATFLSAEALRQLFGGRPVEEVAFTDLVMALVGEGGSTEQVGECRGTCHGSWVVNRQGRVQQLWP